ncbi:hypothetical protein E2320_005996 [Naja naja]|nr:hypothetical protein E2320_005996 [Naja naja]
MEDRVRVTPFTGQRSPKSGLFSGGRNCHVGNVMAEATLKHFERFGMIGADGRTERILNYFCNTTCNTTGLVPVL